MSDVIPFKNDQEVYDAVKKWLLRPGATRCISEETGSCMYVDRQTGNKCAIGGILSENLLKIATELDYDNDGLTVGDLINKSLSFNRLFINCDHGFLTELQRVHDAQFNWDHQNDGKFCGELALNSVARNYGLNS